MSDQADKLRQLIHAPGRPGAGTPRLSGAPMVVVTGARPGVGATTVAVNLAAVLADRFERVLIVDADEQRSNMAEIAGLRRSADYTLADVTAGKCNIADALSTGPAGSMVALGRDRRGGRKSESRRDLATWLHSFGDEFDVVVVDAGNRLTPATRRLWLASKLVLLVATAEDDAVMDAYAGIKLHAADASIANVRVLMNQTINDRAAADAERRLTSCCQRFLAHELSTLPALPRNVEHEDALRCAQDLTASEGLRPRVWQDPNSPFGHAALWLGRAVGDLLSATAPSDSSPSKSRRRKQAECAAC